MEHDIPIILARVDYTSACMSSQVAWDQPQFLCTVEVIVISFQKMTSWSCTIFFICVILMNQYLMPSDQCSAESSNHWDAWQHIGLSTYSPDMQHLRQEPEAASYRLEDLSAWLRAAGNFCQSWQTPPWWQVWIMSQWFCSRTQWTWVCSWILLWASLLQST